MRLSELLRLLGTLAADNRADPEIVIPVTDYGGLGPTPAVSVGAAYRGIDWDADRVFLRPSQPVSRLSEADIQAIHKSLRGAQSWHAYKAYKAMAEKVRAAEERAETTHKDSSGGNHCDLVAHLRRQQDFSERTFGPGPRTRGVLDHIAKELAEIAEHPDDLEEWIDVVLLALDGAWPARHAPEAIAAALAAKQAKNEERVWPDWRTAPPGQAIEHVRHQEHPAPPQQPCPCRHCEEQRGDTINGFPSAWSHMIVCSICGNKHCPHADNHTFPCTGSNAPGQASGTHQEGDQDDSQ